MSSCHSHMLRDSSRNMMRTTRSSSQDLGAPPANLPPPVPQPSKKRWSSALEYSGLESNPRNVNPLPPPRPSRSSRAASTCTSYSDALIRSSQRLRERSMTPPPAVIIPPRPSPYKTNKDFYRARTKSVYEKESIFRDFARNIPLSQSNLYDNNNLSCLKNSFKNMLYGKSSGSVARIPDPYKPSADKDRYYVPQAESLSRKHHSSTPGPSPLPYIYVYHRNTRK